MKEKKEKTEKDWEVDQATMKYIGERYRRTKLRNDFEEIEGVKEHRKYYDQECTFIARVDRCLQECTRTTRLVIQEGYLKPHEEDWYLDYWCRTTYYRKKRLAIEEFLRCFNAQ